MYVVVMEYCRPEGCSSPKRFYHLAEQKPSRGWSADVGHDAAILGVRIALKVDVTRYPVIKNPLVPLFHVVLATIVNRRHEGELLEIVICWTMAGEGQALLVPKFVGVLITAPGLTDQFEIHTPLGRYVDRMSGISGRSTLEGVSGIRPVFQIYGGI